MSKTYPQINLPYFTEGIIRSAQLSDNIAPENSVQLAVNGNFDRIGSFQTRAGMTQYATPLSGPILSFGKLAIQSTGVRRLLAQVGNTIYSWNGTTWSNVRTLSSSTAKARYSQYLDLVFTVNGNSNDVLQTFDGTSYGSTNVASLPKGDYVNAGFEGRVWVANAATDYLYYSDIVSPTGLITGGTDYIFKLSSQDGESITGLHRVPRALLVFKQNHIYRVYGAASIDNYPAYNVGTFSQESIIEAKDGTYFHHSSGFYKFNYDGQPVEISRRIKDFVRAIDRTFYSKIVGVWDGTDAVEWSIGTVTVEGATYRNCIVRYSISTQVWTVYDLSGSNLATSMISYDDGSSAILPIVGTSTGAVATLEKGKTDLGEPIYFELISRWMSLTETWSRSKAISGMAVQFENGGGVLFQYQINSDKPDEWRDIDTAGQGFVSLFPNMSTQDFNRFRFRMKGITKGDPIIFNGWELISLQDKGYDQN